MINQYEINDFKDAQIYFEQLEEEAKQKLINTIIKGLPGN